MKSLFNLLFIGLLLSATTVIGQTNSTKNSSANQKSNLQFLEYEEFLGTEMVKDGSRLAQISRRWYGEQAFWVYIYEANSYQIKDPNKVYPGTILQIPKMDPELVNPNNPESVAKANALKEKYLKKK